VQGVLDEARVEREVACLVAGQAGQQVPQHRFLHHLPVSLVEQLRRLLLEEGVDEQFERVTVGQRPRFSSRLGEFGHQMPLVGQFRVDLVAGECRRVLVLVARPRHQEPEVLAVAQTGRDVQVTGGREGVQREAQVGRDVVLDEREEPDDRAVVVGEVLRAEHAPVEVREPPGMVVGTRRAASVRSRIVAASSARGSVTVPAPQA